MYINALNLALLAQPNQVFFRRPCSVMTMVIILCFYETLKMASSDEELTSKSSPE